MRLLLDTHVFLWMAGSPERLPASVLEKIRITSTGLYVSIVSLWEMALKESIGKLRAPDDWSSFMEGNRIELLPLQVMHLGPLRSLPFHHRDPFDRMLVCQARAENLTLLTADTRLAAYGPDVWLV